jgi:hypothetical protein
MPKTQRDKKDGGRTVRLEKSEDNYIMHAALMRGRRRLMHLNFARGRKHEELYLLGQGPRKNRYYFGICDVFIGDRKVLSVTGRIYPDRQSIAFHVRDAYHHTDYVIDFSDYSINHLGQVCGSADGNLFTGTFNPRAARAALRWRGKRTGKRHPALTLSLDLHRLIDNRLAVRLQALQPIYDHLETHRHQAFAPFRQKFEDVLRHSDFLHNMANDACWGFGGLGMAASCWHPAGPVTCPVGAYVFGHAASACARSVADSEVENPGGSWHPDPAGTLPTGRFSNSPIDHGFGDRGVCSPVPEASIMSRPEEGPMSRPEEGPMSGPEEGPMSGPEEGGMCSAED